MRRPRPRPRARLVVLGVVGTLVLAGCSPERDPEALADFCESAAALADGSVLHGLDLTAVADLSADDPSLAAAVDSVAALEAAPAPTDIEAQWLLVVDPLAAFLESLRDADLASGHDGATDPAITDPAITDPATVDPAAAVRAAADALVEPEVVAAGDEVDAYVAEHC